MFPVLLTKRSVIRVHFSVSLFSTAAIVSVAC